MQLYQQHYATGVAVVRRCFPHRSVGPHRYADLLPAPQRIDWLQVPQIAAAPVVDDGVDVGGDDGDLADNAAADVVAVVASENLLASVAVWEIDRP